MKRKQPKTKDILGCSLSYFKKHIESQFQKNMSFENYGEWHIDHIIPISKANTIKEIESLSHYSNLQPLWAEENFKKSNNTQ